MNLGKLTFEPTADHLDLVAAPVKTAIAGFSLTQTSVAAIDAALSDTAAFCEHYGIGLEVSANCVVVEAKRADRVWYAACVILATDKVDINGVVRKQLGARKISFAPVQQATSLTAMEFGGITPIGLPSDWPILVDTKAATAPYVIIGAGLRKSKLLVPGSLLAQLPGSIVRDIAKSA